MSVVLAAVLAAVLAVTPAGSLPPAPRTSSSPKEAVIAVVAPAMADPAVTEALSRFRGEAAAVGFTVVVVAGSPTTTVPLAGQMESAARAASAVATVAFVSGADPRAIDVWFTDRHTGKTALGHLAVETAVGERASVVLAVKVVDFLRARMADALGAGSIPATAAGQVGPPTPTTVTSGARADGTGAATATPLPAAAPEQPVPTPPPARISVSLGVGVLRSLQGLGTQVMPVLRGAYALAGWSSVRVSLGALGTSSTVEAMGGAATVREDFGAVEWVITPGRGHLRPRLAVGAGVHHFTGRGTAAAPYVARDGDRFTLATAVAVGGCALLGPHLALAAEAGVFLLFPEPQVGIAGLDAGGAGRPGLSLIAAMEARF